MQLALVVHPTHTPAAVSQAGVVPVHAVVLPVAHSSHAFVVKLHACRPATAEQLLVSVHSTHLFTLADPLVVSQMAVPPAQFAVSVVVHCTHVNVCVSQTVRPPVCVVQSPLVTHCTQTLSLQSGVGSAHPPLPEHGVPLSAVVPLSGVVPLSTADPLDDPELLPELDPELLPELDPELLPELDPELPPELLPELPAPLELEPLPEPLDELASEPPDDDDEVVASPPSPPDDDDMVASPLSVSDASSSKPESSPLSVEPESSPLSVDESSPELDPPLDAPELTPDELDPPPELDEDPRVDPSRPEPTVDVLDPPPQPAATIIATRHPSPKLVFNAFILRSSPW